MKYLKCPVCEKFATTKKEKNERFEYQCFVCGSFTISEQLFVSFNKKFTTSDERVCLSNYLSLQKHTTLSNINFNDTVKYLVKPNPAERADNLFLYLAHLNQEIGSVIPYAELIEFLTYIFAPSALPSKASFYDKQFATDFKYVLRAYSQSHSFKYSEIEGLIDSFLIKEKKYLEEGYGSFRTFNHHPGLIITPRGWSFFNENIRGVDSSQGFIAIDFDPKFNDLIEWIKAAIKEAGYSPMCLKGHDHNVIIDDEMYLQIRKSKFLIADLSSDNNGAYFEAGFALGLDKDVIPTCKEGHSPHFDINHRLLTKWNPDDPEKFIKALTNRILNTIGEG
ncbi:MAG: hypothetical protein HQ528_09310 [Candidatus Marinimicrobia bacterium]|nr:hypothetical protein [Candidatus Neomarinimicrobiota bacterium]